MPNHIDQYHHLNLPGSIREKVRVLYDNLRVHYPFITRLAVALHDPKTDLVATFVYAAEQNTPLPHYEIPLSKAESLKQTALTDTPRVINDLQALEHSSKKHTLALLGAGYLASYTIPMVFNNRLLGFVFFNASQKNVFNESVMSELDMVAHMVTLLVYSEESNVNTLKATVKTALDLTHSRDPETGTHLERMSRYARIIATELAEQFNLSDEVIEHIYLFAPLHDIGKLRTPDNILLKSDKLTADEFEVMKCHPGDGLSIINKLLDNYGLNGVGYVSILRNIAHFHHELLDGSGYPNGIRDEDIPIEARIVTVADVFDALTSRRPYKEAWPVDQAFEHLRVLAQSKLDPNCVEALIKHREQIEMIMSTFKENPYG